MTEEVLKTFFVEYDKVHTDIRAKKILYGKDYILYSSAHNPHIHEISNNFEKEGVNIQSLIVKVKAKDAFQADMVAKKIKYKAASYLAGIFQVSFFFLDSGFDYQVYDKDPIPYREKFLFSNPITDGHHVLYSIGGLKKYSVLVDKLPDFDEYSKFENIFYLWRSASDGCNEIGWRFLNYFRIIELCAKNSLGGSKRNERVYKSLPHEVTQTIDFSTFNSLVDKWRHPAAHGNISNVVIPTDFHGQYDSNPDLFKLFEIVRLLIRSHIKKSLN